jgi:TolA-binding protein
VKDHPEHKYAGAAHYIGGNAGMNAKQFERAEAMYRAMLEKHPDNRHIDKARNELVSVLEDARKLPECITQCEANLQADAASRYAERWRYMVAACRFRVWEFKQAEKGLKAFLEKYPGSNYSRSARNYLEQINPPLELDANGVVKGYDGKYVEDVRFIRALRNLPGYVKEAARRPAIG